ncbi:MAG: nucleotide exchange factor GrpE [Pelolinea sp.]|nr:nucleotide exchange factor GrpE [Pelolinea sp.]
MTEKEKKHKEEKLAEDKAAEKAETAAGEGASAPGSADQEAAETIAGEQASAPGSADQEAAETVTLPLKDYAGQLEELDDLRKKADDFSDGWLRERADFANYRKRVTRDQEIEKQNSKVAILRKYLDIHDDLELAIKNMPEHVKSDAWVNGIMLIYQKFSNLLNGEGLQPIPAENCAFDPALHEAISSEEDEGFESGKIIEVVQKGYAIGDRVIRPARVRVAK